MVAAAAILIAGVALVLSVLAFRRQMASNISHAPEQAAPMFRRAKRRPVVRDDLAAFRQEEKERYEWEAKLREQER